jgi:hypothetical protein
MDVSDIGMIMRDCTPKPAKPSSLKVKAAGLLIYKDGDLNTDGWHWESEGPGPWTQREMAVLALEYIIEQIKQEPHESGDVLMWPDGAKTKPTKLSDQRRADWLPTSPEPAGFNVSARIVDQDARNREMTETLRRVQDAGWIEACAAPYGEQPELHPRRHLDWPVIDPEMIRPVTGWRVK